MRVSLSNFGPIISGTLELRRLTVLIGPNNSGKSYASALTRSLFSSAAEPRAWYPIPYGPFPFGFGEQDLYDRLERQLRQTLRAFAKELASNAGGNVQIPDSIVVPIWQQVGVAAYQERLRDTLERNFACKLTDLIRIGQSRLELGFRWNDASVEVHSHFRNKLRLGGLPAIPDERLVRIVRRDESPRSSRSDSDWVELRVTSGPPLEMYAEELLVAIVQESLERLAPCLQRSAHYLPAARSGILQGHRALVCGILDAASRTGLRPLQVPQLSGLASDFISSILSLPQETGPYSKLAREFEGRLINGRVAIREDDEMRYPDLYYEFRNQEIPLHRSSSTVSELAPIFLYLKHIVQSGDLLIIEEPEAHLHPLNQRILAALLVRLANAGLNLLVTTHSEFLLGELNNRMMMHTAQARLPIDGVDAERMDRLDPADVSVFVFRERAEAGGFVIEPVDVDPDEGISEEEFLAVHEELYEDSLVYRRHQGGAGGDE